MNFFVVYAQPKLKNWNELPGCMVDGVPTLKCLEVVFENILTVSSAFIVFGLFVMFTIGSFQYLTSLGNPDKLKKAQGTLKFALLGFILFLSAYLILFTIDTLFLKNSGSLLKFTIP